MAISLMELAAPLLPKGPFRTQNAMALEIVMFHYHGMFPTICTDLLPFSSGEKERVFRPSATASCYHCSDLLLSPEQFTVCCLFSVAGSFRYGPYGNL